MLGIFFGYQKYSSRPQPRVVRLAPSGTYYLLEYVSIKTPRGITGVIPGQEVHEVRKTPPAPGKMCVRYGDLVFEVDCGQLTDDVDLASSLFHQDEDEQRRLTKMLSAQDRMVEDTKVSFEVARAEGASRISKRLQSASVVGNYDTRLNDQPRLSSSGAGGATSYSNIEFRVPAPSPVGPQKYERR